MPDTFMTEVNKPVETTFTQPSGGKSESETQGTNNTKVLYTATAPDHQNMVAPVITPFRDTQPIIWKDTIGIFYNEGNLQDAVNRLTEAGFDKSEVSILADEATLRKELGKKFRNVRELAYDPNTPRRHPVLSRQLSMTQGLAIVVGAAVGMAAATATAITTTSDMTNFEMMITMMTGSLSGTLIGLAQALMMSRRHTKNIREQIKRGGLLLWVHVKGSEQERKAREILKQSAARDINVYEFAAATAVG